MAKKRRTALERIAYHEAGHAAVAMEYGRDFDAVSIEPSKDNDSAGRVAGGWEEGFDPDMQRSKTGDDELLHCAKVQREILIRLAGPAAVKRLTGRYDNPRRGLLVPGGDRHVCNVMAHAAEGLEVCEYLVAYLNKKASELVSRPHIWPMIQALAAELLRVKHLTGDKARKVMRSALRKKRTRKRTVQKRKNEKARTRRKTHSP